MRIGIQALALQGANDFRKAGVARYAYCIIDEMLRIGDEDEFWLFLSPDFDPPLAWSERPNVHIHRRWRKQRLWLFFIGGLMAKLWKLDVWFSVANSIPPVGWVKRAIFMHDLFPLRRPEFYNDDELEFYRSNFTFSCKNADLILTNSEATKREVAAMFSPSAPIVVTYLGPGNIAARGQAVEIPFERFIFTLGTLEPRKNLTSLIEAFARVKSDVGLVIGGGRGWKEDAIFERVKELGIEERVLFLGYVEDEALPDLFARCEFFVYPSLDEGFGIPVLEAMLYGAPVLSSNAGALPEVGGEAVRYFSPTDIPAMSKAIEEALQDENRAVWAEKGHAQAAKFSWKRCAQETLIAFKELAQK